MEKITKNKSIEKALLIAVAVITLILLAIQVFVVGYVRLFAVEPSFLSWVYKNNIPFILNIVNLILIALMFLKIKETDKVKFPLDFNKRNVVLKTVILILSVLLFNIVHVSKFLDEIYHALYIKFLFLPSAYLPVEILYLILSIIQLTVIFFLIYKTSLCCINCGNINQKGQKFCSKCGAKL